MKRLVATNRCFIKDIKKMGWKLVDPTTVYAFIQAMGLINDPLQSQLKTRGFPILEKRWFLLTVVSFINQSIG